MTIARRPLLAFAGLGLLVAAPFAGAAERLVKGSGVATTQRREVGAFAAIGLSGPFAVLLRAGNREAVEIVADDNILPLIETKLSGLGPGRSLEIALVRDTRVEPRTPIVVTIDYVRLEGLAVGGSGRIGARSMKATRLDASIGGSGSIDLVDLDVGALSVAIGGSGGFRADGRARKLSVSIGGSGRCDAERLVAGEVDVAVAGSGDTRVHAETALQATIAGSGSIFHSGAATPQAAIVGSGRVRRI
jgi:putative autotransporter adhesin-like protein